MTANHLYCILCICICICICIRKYNIYIYIYKDKKLFAELKNELLILTGFGVPNEGFREFTL